MRKKDNFAEVMVGKHILLTLRDIFEFMRVVMPAAVIAGRTGVTEDYLDAIASKFDKNKINSTSNVDLTFEELVGIQHFLYVVKFVNQRPLFRENLERFGLTDNIIEIVYKTMMRVTHSDAAFFRLYW